MSTKTRGSRREAQSQGTDSLTDFVQKKIAAKGGLKAVVEEETKSAPRQIKEKKDVRKHHVREARKAPEARSEVKVKEGAKRTSILNRPGPSGGGAYGIARLSPGGTPRE